jgi:hypothetical protein
MHEYFGACWCSGNAARACVALLWALHYCGSDSNFHAKHLVMLSVPSSTFLCRRGNGWQAGFIQDQYMARVTVYTDHTFSVYKIIANPEQGLY